MLLAVKNANSRPILYLFWIDPLYSFLHRTAIRLQICWLSRNASTKLEPRFLLILFSIVLAVLR
jgi:hypothetical protein